MKHNMRFGSGDLDEGGMLADLVLEVVGSSITFVTENKVVVAVQCPLWHCSATFQKTKRTCNHAGFYSCACSSAQDAQ